jgi:hypothetical protein
VDPHVNEMEAADLRRRRDEILAAHVDAENREDVDAVIATFRHPRYELVPTREIFDGEAEVRRYYRDRRTPGRRYEVVRAFHADDAVIVEIRNRSLEPHPPYRVDLPSIAIFEFDGADLVCERVYWDLASFAAAASG